MDIDLTNQEKTAIINQHLKNIVINIYNLNIAIISESSLTEPNQDNLDNLNDQLAKENIKKQALLEEYAKLNEG